MKKLPTTCYESHCTATPAYQVWTKSPGPIRKLCERHAFIWGDKDWVSKATRLPPSRAVLLPAEVSGMPCDPPSVPAMETAHLTDADTRPGMRR